MQSASRASFKSISAASIFSKLIGVLRPPSSLTQQKVDQLMQLHNSSRMQNVRGCGDKSSRLEKVIFKAWNYSAGPPKPRKIQTNAHHDPTKFRNVRGCGSSEMQPHSNSESLIKKSKELAQPPTERRCEGKYNCALRYMTNQ